ncbi:uncharacterized protein LOC143883777 isoform X2 [Tasmannia lanceolata]|uniref:uncharacterized protein LOC143883777 isoform X2 n=1 Tax=Tasmannia lanceolata TaxID=3420 RepID=UPI004064908E
MQLFQLGETVSLLAGCTMIHTGNKNTNYYGKGNDQMLDIIPSFITIYIKPLSPKKRALSPLYGSHPRPLPLMSSQNRNVVLMFMIRSGLVSTFQCWRALLSRRGSTHMPFSASQLVRRHK